MRSAERHFDARALPESVPKSDVSVSLEPVTPEEYRGFVEAQVREFADQKVRAGHWQPAESQTLARHVIEGSLPHEGPTEGHRIWKAVDGRGERVGWIWVGPPPVKTLNLPTRRWLYQITVEPAERRQGYGRAMLEAVEQLLASEGVRDLYLNVFRWNTAARSLYDSSGYNVVYDGDTETGMKKSLPTSVV